MREQPGTRGKVMGFARAQPAYGLIYPGVESCLAANEENDMRFILGIAFTLILVGAASAQIN